MPPNNHQSILSQLSPLQPVKRKVFVSYHHARDQASANNFRNAFSYGYDIFYDASLNQPIGSLNPLYINRTIREDYITGTSITIVLCGIDTWKRKYIDWEIHSTLDKDHALLGIMLPGITGPIHSDGQRRWIVPGRLHTNIVSGYAHFITWPQTPQELSAAINHAIQRSRQNGHYKNNSAAKLARNL
jgi:hypothetical protein